MNVVLFPVIPLVMLILLLRSFERKRCFARADYTTPGREKGGAGANARAGRGNRVGEAE